MFSLDNFMHRFPHQFYPEILRLSRFFQKKMVNNHFWKWNLHSPTHETCFFVPSLSLESCAASSRALSNGTSMCHVQERVLLWHLWIHAEDSIKKVMAKSSDPEAGNNIHWYGWGAWLALCLQTLPSLHNFYWCSNPWLGAGAAWCSVGA